MTRNRIDKTTCEDLIKAVLKTSTLHEGKQNENSSRRKTITKIFPKQNDGKNSRDMLSYEGACNGRKDNKKTSNFGETNERQNKTSHNNSGSKQNWKTNDDYSTSRSISLKSANNRKDLLFDKRDFFFPDLPKRIREQMQLDAVAHYSVTDTRTADKISDFIAKFDGLKKDRIVITDGTACIGGNTISFCKYFKRVQAIELDETRYTMLKHNLKTLGCENAQCYHGNYLEYLDRLTQDIVFLDPPWGGPSYREKNEVELFVGDISLDEICEKLKLKTKYIVIKAPTNMNSQKLREKFGDKVEIHYGFRKMLLIVVDFHRLRKYQSSEVDKYDSSKMSITLIRQLLKHGVLAVRTSHSQEEKST